MTTKTTIGHGSMFALFDDGISPPAYVDVAEVTNITPYSASQDAVDTTHSASPDRAREFIPGLVDYGEASIEMNFAPGSPSDKRIRSFLGTKKRAKFQVKFPTSPAELLQGEAVLTGYNPSVPLDDKMTAQATWKISGKPTMVGET